MQQIKPKVAEYIDKIKALGHEIIVITARDKTLYTDEYKTTVEELKNNNIHYDKLICDFDKAKVCKIEKIDLFIDDSITNIHIQTIDNIDDMELLASIILNCNNILGG